MNTFFILLLLSTHDDRKSIYDYLDGHIYDTPASVSKLSFTSRHRKDLNAILWNMLFHKYIDSFQNVIMFPRHRVVRNVKHKYATLKDIVLSNTFIGESNKNAFLKEFGRLQKVYFKLSRFAYRWKWNRAIVPIDQDLYFNPIDICKPYNFILFQNNVKYYFRVCDLLKTIESKVILYDSSSFEIMSEPPINPYTKKELTCTDLYNLYSHLRHSNMKIPPYFELFCKCNFDLNVLGMLHDTALRKMAIKNFVLSEPDDSRRMMLTIVYMLRDFDLHRKVNLFSEFPVVALTKAFRPYVYLYYLIQYGNIDCTQAEYYEDLLSLHLKLFVKKNPKFGRKIYKTLEAKDCSGNPFSFEPKPIETFVTSFSYVFHSYHM